MIGYLIYGNVVIAVDLFSQKSSAMKDGEIRVLDNIKSLQKQIYEALSGNEWDNVIEKIDSEFHEEII